MRCGKGIGMWERFGKCKDGEKKNSRDTSEKWRYCARNGVSG